MDAYIWLMIILMIASGVVLWIGFLGFQKHEEAEHGHHYGPHGHNNKH